MFRKHTLNYTVLAHLFQYLTLLGSTMGFKIRFESVLR